MSQISPPIRIAIAVAALFLVAWMTVLKPKSAAVAPTPAPITTGNVATGKPAVSTPGKLAEKAKDAVQKSDSAQAADTGQSTPSTAATGSTTPSTGATAATGTATNGATPSAAAAPAAVPADLKGVPAPAVKAILAQKVLVIGFFDAKSADDAAVRSALRGADRWNGRVYVKAASISKVGAWGRIARGVDVAQSPTIVVVARDLKATTLVGYVDEQTIDQAVVDALRSSGGLFTSAYLRKVNRACAERGTAFVSNPGAAGARRWKAFVADLAAVKAPARFRGFERTVLADARQMRTAKGGTDARAQRSFQAHMGSRHVLACSS